MTFRCVRVLDTCVLVDFYSCHNVTEAWNGADPLDEEKLAERCARGRDALLLAIAFVGNVRTHSLAREPLDMLARRPT